MLNNNNVGNNSNTFISNSLTNGDQIKCIMTSSLTGCITNNPDTSNVIPMSVTTALPVSVTITADPVGPICQSTNVTFTATPFNGGSTPGYHWYKNGAVINGYTNNWYTTSTLADGDIMTCVMTSSLNCTSHNPDTSNSIIIIVNPYLNADVSISAMPSGAICSGTNVTFTATPINGGNNPSYQWKLNGSNTGTNSPTYTTSTLTNGNYISCIMTSDLTTCISNSPATSNTISTTVHTIPPTPVISNAGSYLHSNATSGNQWYLNSNSIGGATGQNHTPVQNGSYYVIVTLNGCSSSPSNTITITNVGIDDVEGAKLIKVYPNPVTNELIIEIEGNNKAVHFNIINSVGQVVFKGKLTDKEIISTSDFAPGVYLIKLETGKGVEFKKVVKE